MTKLSIIKCIKIPKFRSEHPNAIVELVPKSPFTTRFP